MPEQAHEILSTGKPDDQSTERLWGRGNYQLSVVSIRNAEDNPEFQFS